MHLSQFIFGFTFLVTSSFALSNTEFTYNVIDGGIEITGCVDACPSDLVIPEEIDGFSVTSIGHTAFMNKQITSLFIPGTLTNIDYAAFASNELTSVFIPNSVTSIGERAFWSNQLTSVNIPDNLTTIEEYTFHGNHLTNVTFPSNLTNIGNSSFGNNDITELVFPSSITSIGGSAFSVNELTSVIFLGNRPEIDIDAFNDNIFLENILYCSGATGWPGEDIQDLTIQLDSSCESEVQIQYSPLDLDQNGSFEALTDALILLRYAFGLRGDNLISDAIATDGNRTSAEDIEEHIQSLLP